MKKIILPLALLFMITTSCTKENLSRLEGIVNKSDDHGGGAGGGGGDDIATSAVPDSVMNAFNERYPGAEVREWKRLGNGNYKAEFTFNGGKWEAIFTANGELVKEERES